MPCTYNIGAVQKIVDEALPLLRDCKLSPSDRLLLDEWPTATDKALRYRIALKICNLLCHHGFPIGTELHRLLLGTKAKTPKHPTDQDTPMETVSSREEVTHYVPRFRH